MKRLLAVFLTGALLILAFPLPDIGWLAFFALIPLLLALDGQSPRSALLLGILSGMVFYVCTIGWISHVTGVGMGLLAIYCALYFGLFSWLISLLMKKSPLFLIFFVPSLWVALEFLRSYFLTGFPWALLGYTQYKAIHLIQISRITGVYGVSWLVVLMNTACFLFLKRRALLPLLITGTIFFPVILYGNHVMQIPAQRGPEIALIQGNIKQEMKWDPRFADQNLAKYDRLTRAAAIESSPELIIWPETAFPGYYPQDSHVKELKKIARAVETPLLVGSPVFEGGRIFNSAILFSSIGRELNRYNKIHLVPFGEYLPIPWGLSFLKLWDPRIGSFSAGKDFTVFTEGPIPFSILICFEDAFPGLVRRFVQNGSRLLVNMTNDAWFKDTGAPFQHLQASVFRAVENGVPVARAANTGVTAMIDPWGRITKWLENSNGNKQTFVEGYVSAKVSEIPGPTFYNRYGDLFAILCLIGVLLCTVPGTGGTP
jgi:apolipoprotein N-acyltransferase